MARYLIILVFLLSSLCKLALAEEFTNLYLVAYAEKSESRTCYLKQPDADIIHSKKNAKMYEGIRTDDSCHVVIQAPDFDKENSFCYLSGFRATDLASIKDIKCGVAYTTMVCGLSKDGSPMLPRMVELSREIPVHSFA